MLNSAPHTDRVDAGALRPSVDGARARKVSRAPEINPYEKNIPGGWPRAFYRDDAGKPRYTQWSSGQASEQIGLCDSDRLWTSGKFFACTSCAQVMERGLMMDLDRMRTEMDKRWPEGVEFEGSKGFTIMGISVWGGSGCTFGEYDGQYGGALCHRCLVFALKHCPYFARLHTLYGEDLLFIEVLDGKDFGEFDETGAVDVRESGLARPRISLAEVRQRVAQGQMYLAEHNVAAVVEARPCDENGLGLLWNPPID